MLESEYVLTVGLEVHAELKTRTKMFCNSKNDSDETRPNVNICPVCMGHPGTLPVINKEAVKHVLKVGLALGGTLAAFTEFDRKNYFYPDIPKGYQLSQYEFPLVRGGSLNGIAITRVHLEEDTATSLHRDTPDSPFVEESTAVWQEGFSLVDFNRAGIPLMELVTEPVIHSAKEAGNFARELQLLLRYLGASDANMEKGEMRVEANISVAPISPLSPVSSFSKLGTKVEVKNLNSFRTVERAIAYEYERQVASLGSGAKIIQETRGWDESEGKTFGQRRKEESHDYRYFPDPDLPKLSIREIPEFAESALWREMPGLPAARRARYAERGLREEDAQTLVENRALALLFDEASKHLAKESLTLAASYITSDLLGIVKKTGQNADTASFAFAPEAFAELIRMIHGKKLSSRGAKDILAVMHEKGGSPEKLASELGLMQKSDAGELRSVAECIIAANPKAAEDYRGGKMAALQFLVGQGMKATKGSANPETLRNLFAELLQ